MDKHGGTCAFYHLKLVTFHTLDPLSTATVLLLVKRTLSRLLITAYIIILVARALHFHKGKERILFKKEEL